MYTYIMSPKSRPATHEGGQARECPVGAVAGFRGLGFRGLGFRDLGFRV